MRDLRKLLMSLPLLLAFSMYMFAQGGGGGGGGAASGGAGGATGGHSAPGEGSSVGTSTSEAPPAQGAVRADTHSNKTLSGCVESSGDQYLLREDNGKTAMLAGKDVSSYVNQQVKLRGDFELGTPPPANSPNSSSNSTNNGAVASSTSSGGPGGASNITTGGEGVSSKPTDHPKSAFVVHHVEKVSDQCKNAGGSSGMSH